MPSSRNPTKGFRALGEHSTLGIKIALKSLA